MSSLLPNKHHENEELFVFVSTICETAICKSCGLIDYKGHAMKLLEEAGDDR